VKPCLFCFSALFAIQHFLAPLADADIVGIVEETLWETAKSLTFQDGLDIL